MQELLRKRVALITGKGGVGRTSISAALALIAKQAGKRVLIAEVWDGTEGTSPLAQLFGRPRLPKTAELIADGIFASQLRPDIGVELFLSSVLHVGRLAKAAVDFDPLRRLFLSVPSLRELGIFFHLLSYLRANRSQRGDPQFDLILIDMPATGHTLALTGLPQIVLQLVSRGPIADALREGQSYMNSADKTAAYVVTLPEELPVSESLELLAGLSRTNVSAGGIFINKVPKITFEPDEILALKEFLPGRNIYGADGFHRSLQAHRAIDRLKASTPLPTLALPALDRSGPDLALELSRQLTARLVNHQEKA